MTRIASLLLMISAFIFTSAQTNDYCLKVNDFYEITVVDGVNVVYKSMTDSAGYATFTCHPDVAHAITLSNEKNKLKVQIISDNKIEHLPTITLYSRALTKATNWGDSTLTVASNNEGAKFNASVIGNGTIVAHDVNCTKVDASVKAGSGHIFITGKAQEANLKIVSAGAIEAAGLEAMAVKCTMIGTGSIDCHPVDNLSVFGTGPGHIYYLGSPKIKNRGVGCKIDKAQ